MLAELGEVGYHSGLESSERVIARWKTETFDTPERLSPDNTDQPAEPGCDGPPRSTRR